MTEQREQEIRNILYQLDEVNSMTTLRPTSLQLLLVAAQTYSKTVIQLTTTPSVATLDRA